MRRNTGRSSAREVSPWQAQHVLAAAVDAGLLAGCVVLSLIAIVLRRRRAHRETDPAAERGRRTRDDRRAARRAAARRGALAQRVGVERSNSSSSSIRCRCAPCALQALQVENDQLRKIMGLGTRLEWGFVPAEALHSTTPNDGARDHADAHGRKHGRDRANTARSSRAEGLVGTIRNADPTMSIAILYTHPDFRASAMSADGSAFGIVYPHPARVGGGDAYMLELRGVPTRVNLKPGTRDLHIRTRRDVSARHHDRHGRAGAEDG